MRSMRVMVHLPPFAFEIVREALGPTGVLVENAPRPWLGFDVVGAMSWDPFTDADMAQLPGLRVIVTPSVGFDHIDTDAAARRGIWVCNVPDYCIEEVADSAIALLLALLRGVVVLDRGVCAGKWDDHAAGPLPPLRGTHLGIVGFGRIGRAVAARAIALGMQVCSADPLVEAGEMALAGVEPATLDHVLTSCFAVTLHLPLTRKTRGIIGGRELALMPEGAFLVNTARADLVDQAALMAALESGRLGGAAVDVLEHEPPSAEHPAPRHPHLIVTPHAAWYSPQSEQDVYRRAALAVRAVIEGRQPEGAVARA